MALICIGLAPFLFLSNFIEIKVKSGTVSENEQKLKEANSLVSDAILNNLTVASFGHEYLLVEKYKEKMASNLKDSIKKAHIGGIIFGFSQFITFCLYGFIFWCGAKFIEQYDADQEDLLTSIFVILFAAWGSGQHPLPKTCVVHEHFAQLLGLLVSKSSR